MLKTTNQYKWVGVLLEGKKQMQTNASQQFHMEHVTCSKVLISIQSVVPQFCFMIVYANPTIVK